MHLLKAYGGWIHLQHSSIAHSSISFFAYLLAISYGKSPQTSKLDGEDNYGWGRLQLKLVKLTTVNN